ncbi:MAG: SDR family NAD(P)-dependent oxidoreductase [Gammaproteobacteria bacterium]
MGELEGRVAIVTGAGRGILRASALALAGAGAAVMAIDIDEAGATQTAAVIGGAGGHALGRHCDVTNRAQVDAAVGAAVSAFGRVDIVVNGATVFRMHPFEEQTEEDLMQAWRVNVLGTFNCMQAAFPHLRAQGYGKIVNFGSGAATSGAPGQASYAAAKEGVRGLTRTAAREWGRHGIRVNSLIPMAVTPGFENAVRELGRDLGAMASAVPLGRLGDPARDVAPVVVFLASAASDFMTGRTLFADGGQAGYL